ncbi:sorbin and SH3 domain-containing protein 1-like [Portunus trituberculatus]|uniref:sorbin and SH3 domain-containing protein 1-like n=1 Tax=Portunus trituberculatus TaxID=210409 RepID=UPI001E1D118D|nr:sorbin and SH3 domain-containing protein 1-like [Portunus trituberculatus]
MFRCIEPQYEYIRTPVRTESKPKQGLFGRSKDLSSHTKDLSSHTKDLSCRPKENTKKVKDSWRQKKLTQLEDIERQIVNNNVTPVDKYATLPNSLSAMKFLRTPDLKLVAKAIYDFSAHNKREISFKKGDIVFIRQLIDEKWYEGEHEGSVGIFPCNYVEVVPCGRRKPSLHTEGQARVIFDFEAQVSMMSLSKGELVILTRRIDENWYEGRMGNRKGIFPVSFVKTMIEPGPDTYSTPSSLPVPLPALPAPNLLYNCASSNSTLGQLSIQNESRPHPQSFTVNTLQKSVPYRALYHYKPQKNDELELLVNDLVMVSDKCRDGWFLGTCQRTGIFGTFPGNYVQRIKIKREPRTEL